MSSSPSSRFLRVKFWSAATLLTVTVALSGCGSAAPDSAPPTLPASALAPDEDGAGSLPDPGQTPVSGQLLDTGQPARVTASSLNLRSGPATTYSVLAAMPSGSLVQVLSTDAGWSKVVYDGLTGWCSATYLTPITTGGVDEAMSRAQSGVGFSYWWGGGCWSAGATEKGSCVGSCPSCSHSGRWGADCSGYVSNVWQIPSPGATSVCRHPYSTVNFQNDHTYWADVPRSSVRRGDALVYNSGGSGHIFLYDNGDAWGWMKAYEAKGCSYGIIVGSRQASTAYKAIRRTGF